MKKWLVVMCGVVTTILIIAGIYVGTLMLSNKKEVIRLPPVIRYIKYDYVPPSQYTSYYSYVSYTNDSFIQAACRWIHYWDALHIDSTPLDIKDENKDVDNYGNLNISWIPLSPLRHAYAGKINITFHRNLGYLEKIRVEMDISDGYKYYLNGYIDSVHADVWPIEINGKEYNKSNNPTLVWQDTSYFYATKFGRNLTAYLQCNLLEEDKYRNSTNISVCISLNGPLAYYKALNLNTTVNITMTIVYKNRIIISKITYHFIKSYVVWALSEPEMYISENITVGEEIYLNLSPSMDSVDEYLIFWGDGSMSNIPKHSYAQPGNYTICVFYRIGKDLSYIAKKEVSVV